ncbi:type II toxin-antitoxin system VapC family toxin [Runella defluvii]|nr:type II toxin-antitoxin system VapC family toxin [Runella defluvii]
MEKYLIDNNTISSFFSALLSETAMAFIASVIDETPILSVITEIEALSWISHDKTKEQTIKEFVADATILALSPEIVAECVRLRRSRKIKTPDAIIAATALVHDLTLISNDKGFENIPRLKLIDPFTL